MKNKILLIIIGAIIGALIASLTFYFTQKKPTVQTRESKIVYSTTKTEGYYFPTHNNLLVMDRSYAETSEVFVVEVAPKKHTHHHIHNDTEQIFYVLSGKGALKLERNGKTETYQLEPTQLVHVPRNCFHQTFGGESDTLRYLAIDCFPSGHNPDESTWDQHAHAICKLNGWDYNKARIKH